MPDYEPSEVLFRASKRRKVIRKPTHATAEDDAPSPTPAAEEMISEQQLEKDDQSAIGVVQARRKGGAGKTGISFSSADARRGLGTEAREDGNQALVVVAADEAAQAPGSDRFVKPMGRVEMKEDKHMMAYVDSKLAETRPTGDVQTPKDIDVHNEDALSSQPSNLEPVTGIATPPFPPFSAATFQQAQARSSRNYQRPTKKKAVPSRKETDVARDSMIEQIMGQNDVPHYQHTTPQQPVEEADDVDLDAAAADAFKAQLLMDLERNRRRPPLSKSAATASSGPKLGGSRSQRERMKAMEEAKGGAGKK